MKPATITFMLAIALLFNAQAYNNTSTANNLLLQQLSAVNAQWPNQPEYANVLANSYTGTPKTFNDWIATHLMLVEKTLRTRSVAGLTRQQQDNRNALLNKLNGYWHQRAFPVNTYTGYKTPVFIDAAGNHCAVGYLMQQSGAEELAQRITNDNRFVYVHNIQTAGVAQWAQTNGFAIDELAWIQPGYPPSTAVFDMDSGVNATVNTMATDPSSQILYIGGNFTQTSGGATMNHIAAWISGFAGYDWMSLGSGVNGNVHTMIVNNGKLYVGGEFTTANGNPASHVAVYDIASSSTPWQALGSGLDGTVRSLAFYNGSLYAGGDFTGNVAKWTGSAWQVITNGMISGSVRTLEAWNSTLVIGGDFDVATGAIRKHVVAYNGTDIINMGFGTKTPVNDFTEHMGKLYAACDVVDGTDTCALAAYDNGEWKVLLGSYEGIGDGFSGTAITSIMSHGTKLIASGNFLCSTGMTMGNNLMLYSRTTYAPDTVEYNVCTPLASTDKPVNTFALQGNQLYFGGEFGSSFGSTGSGTDLNHVAYIAVEPAGVVTPSFPPVSIRIYPNPAGEIIRVETLKSNLVYVLDIFDAAGKQVVHDEERASVKTVPVGHLPQGVYTVHVVSQEGMSNMKLVKKDGGAFPY